MGIDLNWFNHLRIRKKLFIVFGVLISLMTVMTIYSAYQLIRVNRAFDNLTEYSTRRLNSISNAIETLAMLRINNISTAYLINDNEISQSLFILSPDEYEDMSNTFRRHLSGYLENAVRDSTLTAEMIQLRLNLIIDIENFFVTNFVTCFYKILNGLEASDQSLVSEALQEAYNSAVYITNKLDALRETAVDHVENESLRIFAYSQRVIYTQISVAIGILFFAIFVSVFTSRAIQRPISVLEGAATEIAGGNLDYPIRSNRRDELGVLSNYIGDMVDAMKRTNQAKSDFLANMSHEMRTPLNVIVGLTFLQMEDEELSGEIKEDIKKINSAGAILLGLVNDVLDISKIEAGKLELVPVNFQIASLLNDVITLNKIRLESKPINFIIDISENLPAELYGDELRVKQIFNNLLSNAFKYTKTGKITLRVNSNRMDSGEVQLSITVSDTGIGIKQEDMAKLFSDYNQVDTRANREIEGTGLGLSITKQLVNFMNGEIEVESEYGKGTSFHVKIIQAYVNNQTLGRDTAKRLCDFHYTEDKQNLSSGILRPDLSYARVLVVDDYPTNLDVASGMLKKYKMQVDCVQSGQAAIDLIKAEEHIYDAIFMDHMMPEMDGIEAVKIIRALDSEYARTVPIVSLTANALAGNEEMFLDKGFNAFLSKPINILKLDIIVKKWIRKKNKDQPDIDETRDTYESPAGYISADGIPGIDMNVRYDLYAGDMSMYIFFLESFASHTPEAIDKMRNVNEENLSDYAIDVHAFKGMSAAIGANNISERAKKLEDLSKNGELEEVLKDNDKLLDDTARLIENIRDWLEKNNKREQ